MMSSRTSARPSLAGRALHRWMEPLAAIAILATPVLFALYASTGELSWARMAFGTSVAAMPLGIAAVGAGAIDLRDTPRSHRALRLAWPQATLNAASLVLSAFNLALHQRDAVEVLGRSSQASGFDATACLILTSTAAVATTCACALGLVLASRHREVQESAVPGTLRGARAVTL